MDVFTKCPECSTTYRLPNVHVGRRVKCCMCSHPFVVQEATCTTGEPAAGTPESSQSGHDELYELHEEEPTRVVCRACGAILSGDAVVCVRCGFDVRTQKRHASIVEAPAPPGAGPPSQKKRWLWMAALGGGLAITVILLAVFLMRSKPGKAGGGVETPRPEAAAPAARNSDPARSGPAKRAIPPFHPRYTEHAAARRPQDDRPSSSPKPETPTVDESPAVSARRDAAAIRNPLSVVWKSGVPVVRFVPQLGAALKGNEHRCFTVFLAPVSGQVLDRGIAGAGGDGITTFSPITNSVVFFTTVMNRSEGKRLGYRLEFHDTKGAVIHDGTPAELALAGNDVQIDWGWMAPKARIWATISACLNDGDYTFQRFLTNPISIEFDHGRPTEGVLGAPGRTVPAPASVNRSGWSASSYVSPNHSIVLGLRPINILASPLRKALAPEARQQLDTAISQLRTATGMDLDQMEEMVVAVDGDQNLMSMSFTPRTDTRSLVLRQGARESGRHGSVVVYASSAPNQWFALPRPSVLLCASTLRGIRDAIDHASGSAPALDLPTKDDLVLRIKDLQQLDTSSRSSNGQTQGPASGTAQPAPLLPKDIQLPAWAKKIGTLTCAAELTADITIQLTAETEEAAQAKEVAAELNGIKWAMAAGFAQQKKAGQILNGSPEDQSLSKLLARDFVAIGKEVRFSVTLDHALLAAAARAVMRNGNPTPAHGSVPVSPANPQPTAAGGIAGSSASPPAANASPLKTIARADSIVAVYRLSDLPQLKPSEFPALIVFLGRGTHDVLDSSIVKAKDMQAGAGLTGRAVITGKGSWFWVEVPSAKSRNRLGYRFDKYDTSGTDIHGGAEYEIPFAAFQSLASVSGTSGLDWKWLGSAATVSAAVAAFRTNGRDFMFQRFVTPIAVHRFSTRTGAEIVPAVPPPGPKRGTRGSSAWPGTVVP